MVFKAAATLYVNSLQGYLPTHSTKTTYRRRHCSSEARLGQNLLSCRQTAKLSHSLKAAKGKSPRLPASFWHAFNLAAKSCKVMNVTYRNKNMFLTKFCFWLITCDLFGFPLPSVVCAQSLNGLLWIFKNVRGRVVLLGVCCFYTSECVSSSWGIVCSMWKKKLKKELKTVTWLVGGSLKKSPHGFWNHIVHDKTQLVCNVL